MKINNIKFTNKISNKLISTKKLKINVTVIKLNSKDQPEFYNKLKRNNKSMVSKHHMHIPNIIKSQKN